MVSQISYAMVTRKSTFLSSHSWKTIPWSLNPSAKPLLHHLLDAMVDIPELLQTLDRLKKPMAKKQMYCGWNQPLWLQLLGRVEAVISSLELWRERIDKQNSGVEIDLPVMNQRKVQIRQWFPLRPFPGKGLDSGTVRYYSNGCLAQAMITYHACKVTLYDLQAELLAAPRPGSMYESCSSICRSLEYHLCYTPPGCGTLWIFLPLWQVYQIFPESSSEQAWIDELLAWMDDNTPFKISHRVRWPRVRYDELEH